jgi:acetoin utilization deacetylase AcuC-like enzyme
MAKCSGITTGARADRQDGERMNRRASIYTHPACLAHDTGPQHAERPARLEAVVDALRAAFPDAEWIEAPRATRGQLARVHEDRLIDRVLDAPSVPMMLDPDTVLSPHSPEAALRAAGAGVAAIDAVLRGEIDVAFCAVRPPGHHATAGTAMGFCLFDSIAVAAAHALDRHGLSRVSIVDFDVHHGNGTQAIFEHEPRVQYLSSHQMPLYPGTGAEHERGIGNIVNAALPAGAGSDEFRFAWAHRLLPEIDAFAPQLLLVSAGFDADRRDPLAQLELDAADFAWLTTELGTLARRHCDGRIVSMLEGGYDLQALREGCVAHVGTLFAGR